MPKIVKLYHNWEEYLIDEWKSFIPWADTKWYYPLEKDGNDYSGNNLNFGNGLTFADNWYGKSVAYNNVGSYGVYFSWNPTPWTWPKTLSAWVKPELKNWPILELNNWPFGINITSGTTSWVTTWYLAQSANMWVTVSPRQVYEWWWHLVTMVYNNWVTSFYDNYDLIGWWYTGVTEKNTTSVDIWWSVKSSSSYNKCNMSELIFENKKRDLSKILWYYNSTCADYWLQKKQARADEPKILYSLWESAHSFPNWYRSYVTWVNDTDKRQSYRFSMNYRSGSAYAASITYMMVKINGVATTWPSVDWVRDWDIVLEPWQWIDFWTNNTYGSSFTVTLNSMSITYMWEVS